MQGVYLRKYGVSATIDFELYEIDGVDLRTDAVSATGDVTLIRDGGGEGVLDADAFTDEGRSYSLDLSVAEMTAASIIVHVVDQGTKTWLDRVIIIETYGHGSAQHAFDLDTPSVAQSADNDTKISNIKADTEDIQARIPASLASGRMSSDAVAISSSTAAADNLEASAETIIVGAAEAGTLSTTQMSSNLAEATDDHYIGRIVIWTSGVLIGQASDITDYTGVAGVLTFTAVTEAATAADTFIIV
ncbi:MAG TPA: hypothetical protein ENH85_08190 [Candidatus Scalindua sp.]|nr:hypothetical protein [Candidatus Scalindua sp.]